MNAIKDDLYKFLQPALGCSDPGVIAYAAALAAQFQNLDEISNVSLCISGNLMKNVNSVSIPNCDLKGAKVAAACGLMLDYNKKLTLLEELNKNQIGKISNFLDKIKLSVNTQKNHLFVEVEISGLKLSKCIIEYGYDNIVYLSCNSNIVIDKINCEKVTKDSYTLSDLFRWYICNEDDFELIKETINLNEKLIGYDEARYAKCFISIDRIQYCLVSAIEARMNGVNKTVMSNSGSGNQGLMSTIPPLILGRELMCDNEKIYRAVSLSNAVTIYIKKHFGTMSWMCSGCASACGVATSFVYLKNGTTRQMKNAINNVIASITGMICDGAKSSCASKLSCALHMAYLAAEMSLQDTNIGNDEGIIDADVEKTIRNLSRLSTDSSIDRIIVEEMMEKQS